MTTQPFATDIAPHLISLLGVLRKLLGRTPSSRARREGSSFWAWGSVGSTAIDGAAVSVPDARNLNYLAAVRCIASEAKPKLRGHCECAAFEASAILRELCTTQAATN
jgi:hypothetical protein